MPSYLCYWYFLDCLSSYRSFSSWEINYMRKPKKTNELKKILTHWKWQMIHSTKKYVKCMLQIDRLVGGLLYCVASGLSWHFSASFAVQYSEFSISQNSNFQQLCDWMIRMHIITFSFWFIFSTKGIKPVIVFLLIKCAIFGFYKKYTFYFILFLIYTLVCLT